MASKFSHNQQQQQQHAKKSGCRTFSSWNIVSCKVLLHTTYSFISVIKPNQTDKPGASHGLNNFQRSHFLPCQGTGHVLWNIGPQPGLLVLTWQSIITDNGQCRAASIWVWYSFILHWSDFHHSEARHSQASDPFNC